MTAFSRISAILFTLAALLAVAPSALAQSGPAARYLKGQHDQVNRILARPARTDQARTRRNARVTHLLGALLDYESLSQQALGRHWEARSEEDRALFVSLLQQLVERSYQSSLEGTRDYRVRYGDEEQRRGATVVHTTAQSRANRRAPAVAIDYRMRRQGRVWVVIDVITDGVSMVRNYRSQFARIIRRHEWDGLIERMQSRLREGSEI